MVSHGVVLRALEMMWLERTPEWFESEENPENCSIRLVVGKNDKGYIFPGFGRSAKRNSNNNVDINNNNIKNDKANNDENKERNVVFETPSPPRKKKKL